MFLVKEEHNKQHNLNFFKFITFMGCTASKTSTIVVRNSSDEENHSPKSISLPTPLVHHPPTKKGDTHHLVSLTSTTYGSLLLIHQKDSNFKSNSYEGNSLSPPPQGAEQSFSPDSVINTWELMDGLNDDDHDNAIHVEKSKFSKKPISLSETVTENNFCSSPLSVEKKPLWQHLSEEALLAKLDPNVVSSYRKALSSRNLGINNNSNNNLSRGVSSIGSNSDSNSPLSCSSFSNKVCSLPTFEDRIVVYFTSLRGIRKTYEDCCSVRMILRGFRVVVDEKDVSMDSSYRKELENALGGKMVTLPHVFIKGKHVGNAEEIKLLNESGELENLLKGFPIKDAWFVCEICGDARFVPCTNCNGSRKVFDEEEGELRRCQNCNENGLIRCQGCSS